MTTGIKYEISKELWFQKKFTRKRDSDRLFASIREDNVAHGGLYAQLDAVDDMEPYTLAFSITEYKADFAHTEKNETADRKN